MLLEKAIAYKPGLFMRTDLWFFGKAISYKPEILKVQQKNQHEAI